MNSPPKLTRNILLATFFGLAVGMFLHNTPTDNTFLFDIKYLLVFGGHSFLFILKTLAIPVVFISIVNGVISLDTFTELSRIGVKTLAIYLITTVFAVAFAIIVTTFLKPGVGFPISPGTYATEIQIPSLWNSIIGTFTSNPLEAFMGKNMLQLIVISLCTGVIIMFLGERGMSIKKIFEVGNTLVFNLIMLVMWGAPVGVFCLLGESFANEGFDVIIPLAKYFFLVFGLFLLQLTGVYSLVLYLLSGLSPKIFFQKFRGVIAFAFSTASSNATMPFSLATLEKKLGVCPSVASFTVPLGATINMDSVALAHGVSTIFFAQAYGLDLGWSGYLTIILMATFSSIGAAGIPGTGPIMLAVIFKQLNFPLEGIGLIMGVDRILDMLGAAVNVTGDAVATCIVSKSENKLDDSKWGVGSREDFVGSSGRIWQEG